VWVSQRRCILNCQMFYNNDCSQRRTNGNHPPRNCARKKGRGVEELLGGRLSYKQNKQGLPRVKILRLRLGEEKKKRRVQGITRKGGGNLLGGILVETKAGVCEGALRARMQNAMSGVS
jgi:hypothetical protein